jgi:hypothetical protein
MMAACDPQNLEEPYRKNVVREEPAFFATAIAGYIVIERKGHACP